MGYPKHDSSRDLKILNYGGRVKADKDLALPAIWRPGAGHSRVNGQRNRVVWPHNEVCVCFARVAGPRNGVI